MITVSRAKLMTPPLQNDYGIAKLITRAYKSGARAARSQSGTINQPSNMSAVSYTISAEYATPTEITARS
ncbi:hypothetical protein [Samia ricini nucleopolyhedrovirus]|nr:hypothetical protein [Philosamia cynthia ricini nucleopolyhedrovirus virus]BBD51071.1 hypothetical protein [Samia ricini nucleopolyhedrovirus]BBD51220.1 hypothetical protein [Samia ricini nucleopolyhedrovirus]BBD51372.1 hypothetical protein [Samia ricini nucleopolyhedrovirus]